MHDPEANENANTAPPGHLLDELTSIKDLLGGVHAAGTVRPQDMPHIPLLEDIVDLAPVPPALLDIERIFSDDSAAQSPEYEWSAEDVPVQFPQFTLDVALSDEPTAAEPPSAFSEKFARPLQTNYRRELLIEALVAEFLPQITVRLCEHLQSLDDDALQALAKHD